MENNEQLQGNSDVLEFAKTGYIRAKTESEKEKLPIEQARYKQDCRKRAFEMAHSEMGELLRRDKGGDFNVTETADKYYNWLISIPESK